MKHQTCTPLCRRMHAPFYRCWKCIVKFRFIVSFTKRKMSRAIVWLVYMLLVNLVICRKLIKYSLFIKICIFHIFMYICLSMYIFMDIHAYMCDHSLVWPADVPCKQLKAYGLFCF